MPGYTGSGMRQLLAKRARSLGTSVPKKDKRITVCEKEYEGDEQSNVTEKILSHVGRNLHNEEQHPLCLLKKRMVDHFYKSFVGRTGNPLFSVYDNLPPVVTLGQNFDSLLIPQDHPSRNKSDCYYINRERLLRGHTTAHQADLIRMGLDNFLVFGDVYRRDEIDSTHYPVFHQTDGVRLLTEHQLSELAGSEVKIFENGRDGEDAPNKQKEHTLEASKIVEFHLKNSLVGLAEKLYGRGVVHRWVDVYFPFTHPSWELEIEFDGKWMELLGCGIVKHKILRTGGAGDKIGWAFGAGLERIAMALYKIPDIRTFWSTDSGFLSQFADVTPFEDIEYKPVSEYPQCINDMSFWLPHNSTFVLNDFYEVVRDVGGTLVEQVKKVDEYEDKKSGRKSLCFRFVYRSVERTLTQGEVGRVHREIGEAAQRLLRVEIR